MAKALAAKRDPGVGAAGPMEAAVARVEDGRVVIRLGAGAPEEFARVAIPGYVPAPGDRILVQRASSSSAAAAALYVIGVTHAPGPRAIAAAGGARAIVDGDTIAVHDAEGAIVATYDGAARELRIAAPRDLRLAAPEGRVIVEGRGIDLKSDEVSVAASAASVAVGQWELRAERVIERVTDVFRDVDGLFETRARRLRTVVATTLEILGKRTTITSEKDTRIDGERVLLG